MYKLWLIITLFSFSTFSQENQLEKEKKSSILHSDKVKCAEGEDCTEETKKKAKCVEGEKCYDTEDINKKANVKKLSKNKFEETNQITTNKQKENTDLTQAECKIEDEDEDKRVLED